MALTANRQCEKFSGSEDQVERKLTHNRAMLRLLLIDDHAIVREGFKRLFEAEADMQVIGEAGNAGEALELAASTPADVAIIDLSLGADSGLDLLRHLRREVPALRCLVVSMHHDAGFVARALEAGAAGYVTKAVAAVRLPDHVRRVARGERVLSDDLAGTGDATHAPQRNEREIQVLRGILAGNAPKAIALDLGISDKSLYRLRANIMEKLGVPRVSELPRVIRERGLLPML